MFENIVGQDKIREILKQSLSRKRIPHALLFYGPRGVGKEACAIELSKALICQVEEFFACNKCRDCCRIEQLTHPDFYFIFPCSASMSIDDEKKIKKSIVDNPYMRENLWANPTISIDQIRQLKKQSALSSFENKGRVVIIAEANRMTSEAANSLLKLLEEPPSKMTIILTSSRQNLLLPTIKSRCQSLRFDPISWNELADALIDRRSLDEKRAKMIAKVSLGSYRRAIELLDEDIDDKRNKILNILRTAIKSDFDRLMAMEELVKNQDKAEIKELLNLMLLWFRDVMIYQNNNNKSDLIVNVDQMETLEKFSGAFKKLNVEIIVNEIEKSIQLIDRNVYVNLIILNLFYQLKHNLRRDRHA